VSGTIPLCIVCPGAAMDAACPNVVRPRVPPQGPRRYDMHGPVTARPAVGWLPGNAHLGRDQVAPLVQNELHNVHDVMRCDVTVRLVVLHPDRRHALHKRENALISNGG
jgi:hypothetical protein